jgi:hypothetical protein
MQSYPEQSPYNFVLNTPIEAKDPDGRLVIFINGFWGNGTGAHDGGNKLYWSYSNAPGGWADNVMTRIGDHNARFYDGSSGGLWGSKFPQDLFSSNRVEQGYKMGMSQAADIIASLKRASNDPNQIVESVKFVTNSMGAAYQRGFSQALTDYVNVINGNVRLHNADELLKARSDPDYRMNLQSELSGFEIESNLDVAAFQGSSIPADKNSKNNYFMRSKQDIVAGYEAAKVPGATEIGIDSKGEPKGTGHHASAFPTKVIPPSNKNSSTAKEYNEK